ncbi:tryptophan halogenase family protein [Asticcacaulis sp.]|uniref:tryptophan halogenase family protein n=1 Tax=Asticcacaulis sp. TaxID=1872648 RepID=UPI002C2042FA|nr:tryptophan halogenase family protein [Asticcacaulis sp.]HTM81546.1 tryptophan halogenase family protein [Asticcacaulis sp.]
MPDIPSPIRNITIVGGGAAGWMSAAVLSKVLGKTNHKITLIESEEIGTVGVGEATIPMILMFNSVLGLDEDEFIRETHATFKLGIHFVDWKAVGQSYFHPFGTFGVDMDGINFMHFWQRMARSGGNPDYGRYNAETMAARDNRFGRTPKTDLSTMPKINYAFQFDANLYAAFLRRYAEARGVIRQEGKIVKINQQPETGFVTSLELDNGKGIDGDFFLDCSGFRGLLIEETLKSGYHDWSEWLPCNRAAAVPTEKPEGPITPYTRSTAREAGWQWRIPLQHRTGNGYVFCNEFISEDEAVSKLLTRLDARPLKDPKVLRFVTGHRRKMWNKNVVALGLASGFLEPLESTSIHLVQIGLAKLLGYLPRFINSYVAEQYNREMLAEYENVKDFLIAHYHITQREDTPFWRHCKYMGIPESLRARLNIFTETGQAAVQQTELFKEPSWFAILIGQGLLPATYHPVADTITESELKQRLSQIRTGVQDRIMTLPSHDAFIAQHCSAMTRTN